MYEAVLFSINKGPNDHAIENSSENAAKVLPLKQVAESSFS